jgi:hypothetical protein
MWPGDEYVINIAKPAEKLVGHPLQSHLFNVYHDEVGNDWGQW